MSVSELAAMGIVLKFYPKFSSTDNIGNVFFVMLSKSLFFTIIYFLTHIFKQKQAVQDPYDSSELFLTLIPLSSIFVMFTFLNIGETSSFVPPTNIMVTISAFFLILTNLLVFGITQYNQKKSREFTEMQLLLQKESDSAEYYKMLLSQNENRSILIHDIKKHLQSIKLLNEHGETEKIESYISHLIAASDLRETARICDNAMLNAILNRCQRQCIEKGIGFHADIRKNLLRQMNQNDLTSLFCNLLDNAVEAAENIPDSFIDLMVQKKENTPFVVIVLVNSCRSMPDFDQNGFPVSHKSGIGRHGFGIKSIRKAVGQYQGDLKIYYDDATATFHTIITLKQ
nr:sensor histidine kinase [uncultured Blautia sp.]